VHVCVCVRALLQVRDLADWLKSLPHSLKIIIAGNHDLSMHTDYYERGASEVLRHHVKRKADPAQVREYLLMEKVSDSERNGVVYLEDSGCVLPEALGQCTVYGSPWQPEFYGE